MDGLSWFDEWMDGLVCMFGGFDGWMASFTGEWMETFLNDG